MSSIARWSLAIRAWTNQQTCLSKRKRAFHCSPTPALSPATPFDPLAFSWPEIQPGNSKALAIRYKWDQLMDSLTRDNANPSRVWQVYLELGSIMGYENIPLQVHQRTLRKAVPIAAKAGASAARRIKHGIIVDKPYLHEARLQNIIGNIRASGQRPDLEDYHFILQQFTAVAYPAGCRAVFHEIVRRGNLTPTYKTYGLCLQAIAYRLKLPCPFRFREGLYSEAAHMSFELLDDMWQRRIPLTSVNFDLVHRIFKETADDATFEKMLKVGYGIDLKNPDRPPLEIQGSGILMSTNPNSSLDFKDFKPLPFTTAALNTLIDFLGIRGQVSTMVMAFEVLTAPLPVSPPDPAAPSWSDDDDDPAFYQFSSPNTAFKYPCAEPNTTTFTLLIRHAAKAKHAVFARHYLVQAVHRDREVDARLRAELASKPLDQVTSPNFALNRGMLLPLHGVANRTKHLSFLRWSLIETMLILRQKKQDLEFYTEWRDRHFATPGAEPLVESAHVQATFRRGRRSRITNKSAENPDEAAAIIQFDLDTPPTAPEKPITKRFDLMRHLSLLRRDIDELGQLTQETKQAVHRHTVRLKEKLGRRIWRGKDVYVASLGRRVYLRRSEWNRIVGFRTPSSHSRQDSERTVLWFEKNMDRWTGVPPSSPPVKPPPPQMDPFS